MSTQPGRSQPRDEHQPAGTVGTDDALAARLRAHVEAADFPCVGAKAALARDALEVHVFGLLGARANDGPLLDRIVRFARQRDQDAPDDTTVHSLAAVFEGPRDTDEHRFEALLWSQLQRLHLLDVRRGARWARDVSQDPDSPKFSLSLGGHPFFVIGLHAGASRRARRTPFPVLVFNSHRQFDRLREDGRYAKMQAATRARDLALQGSINPNLADFGTAPETRQYSGRAVEADWRCPFHASKGR
ncbi:guanitoxin biosynthesis heme-dependent pre-guanitoxin N-hydroxylase GntA [Arenimonas donghaensis]|nr:guanitoxin biosynthesis heme-dependent pre-guanitoxin N-hydroxylase GntA [Arenimonas donghaensis]